MFFTLEALRAEAGDCLLLHYGNPEEPRVIVIDGGPSKAVYKRLKGRLDVLRKAGGFTNNQEPLPIELLMVSHIDDDHIDGILHLTRQLIEEGNEKSFKIKTMWHNSFDDVIGNHAQDLQTAARDGVETASHGDGFFDQDLVRHDTALVIASVNQGRELRNNAKMLGLNPPLLVAKSNENPRNFGGGMSLQVVGPLKAQVEALHMEWEEHLEKLDREGKLDQTAAASFTDKSAANLASIVVLAEAGGKTMLLTGDARADFLLDSVRAQHLLDENERLQVDLFKLPHHGSNHNVELSTFRQITADHYVVSADGKHGNPDVETFQMLFDGRSDAGLIGRSFTIHLTYKPKDFKAHKGRNYPIDDLEAVLEQARQNGHVFTVNHPADDAESLVIDLDDPFEG